MSPDRVYTVRLPEELAEAMALVQEEHGTPLSEQIRRALRMWLESKGKLTPAAPRRGRKAATRGGRP